METKGRRLYFLTSEDFESIMISTEKDRPGYTMGGELPKERYEKTLSALGILIDNPYSGIEFQQMLGAYARTERLKFEEIRQKRNLHSIIESILDEALTNVEKAVSESEEIAYAVKKLRRKKENSQ